MQLQACVPQHNFIWQLHPRHLASCLKTWKGWTNLSCNLVLFLHVLDLLFWTFVVAKGGDDGAWDFLRGILRGFVMEAEIGNVASVMPMCKEVQVKVGVDQHVKESGWTTTNWQCLISSMDGMIKVVEGQIETDATSMIVWSVKQISPFHWLSMIEICRLWLSRIFQVWKAFLISTNFFTKSTLDFTVPGVAKSGPLGDASCLRIVAGLGKEDLERW